jgi:hypothetical protein
LNFNVSSSNPTTIKNLKVLNFLIIIKTWAQVINIFSKIRQNEKLFNLCQNHSCNVCIHSLCLSCEWWYWDRYQMWYWIWMKLDAEKEGKKTTLWNQFSLWLLQLLRWEKHLKIDLESQHLLFRSKNNIWSLLHSNNNYFRSKKIKKIKNPNISNLLCSDNIYLLGRAWV